MKQYPYKFKLRWNGIEWGQSEVTLGSGTYFYYLYWWNWLDTIDRYWGFDQLYYDGPPFSAGIVRVEHWSEIADLIIGAEA